MRTKPWPILILALIHFLAPIANLLFSSYLMRLSPLEYLNGLYRAESLIGFYSFFLLLPIAGYAIFKIKAWSYLVYISIMTWTFYSNFKLVQDFPEYFSALSMSIIFLSTFLAVSYFLLPAVRVAYFDPRLRWWESQPRYPVDLPIEIRYGSESTQARMVDIALGGIFVLSEQPFEVAQPVLARFFLGAEEILIEAKVVHHRQLQSRGYGLQFIENQKMKDKIRAGIFVLRKQGIKPLYPRNGKIDLKEGMSWLTRLVKTGKGLVPELPSTHSKKDRKS